MKLTKGGYTCSVCVAEEHGVFDECINDTLYVRIDEENVEYLAYDQNTVTWYSDGCPVMLADGILKLQKRFPERKIIQLITSGVDEYMFVAVEKELAKRLTDKVVY